MPFAKTSDDSVVLEFPAELMGKLPFKYHQQQLGMPKRLMLRLKTKHSPAIFCKYQ
ncbi:hypothetical protein [Methylobacter luteus]|uniref:hypothetical protein n=1 Tax=Methylobacter luteus TaxID=415 RepID=UPI0012DE9AC3|nr:hypothetical protein [Methylobacter luteus]